jgi:hypothetical protein
MFKPQSKRAKKLNLPMKRIAQFVVLDAYKDEAKVQEHLANALRSIEEAQKLVDADEGNTAPKPSEKG